MMDAIIKPKLGVKEVAAAFGKTQKTIRNLARKGKLPGARRVNGRWYFDAERLNNFFSK